MLTTILTVLFFSCTTKNETKPATVNPKTLGTIITDSIAPPVVTLITAANAPKKIKAALPTIIPLSYPYGVGEPSFTNYTIADGLPTNFVVSAVKDRDGNLWFGTLAGIIKYDGLTFTNYTTSNGLVSAFTNRLFIDSKNNIWIGTAGFGLNRFDGKSFSRVDLDKDTPLKKDFVQKIMEDRKGNIWIVINGNELFKYTENKFYRFTIADGLSDAEIANIIEDKNGNLLCSTSKGVIAYDGKSFQPYTRLPNSSDGRPAFLSYCDSKGDIWFSNKEGELGRFDGEEIIYYDAKDGYHDGVYNFLEDKAGNYWFTGSNGLTRFDGKHFFTYTAKDGLPSSRIMGLVADEVGNLWATTPNGISKISYTHLAVREQMSARSLAIDKAGNKWVAGVDGFYKYGEGHVAIYGKELVSADAVASRTFVDRNNNIWFTLNNNDYSVLVKFDGVSFSFLGEEQGIPKSFINSIIQDDSNNIWIACGNEIVKFNNESSTLYRQTQIQPMDIYVAFQDSRKNFWFGTSANGVLKYDGKSFIAYDINDGLPDNFVNCITEDPFGNIWLSTDGGAARYNAIQPSQAGSNINDTAEKGEQLTGFREAEGLSNYVPKVVNDSINKVMWFVTETGLASLKYEGLNLDNPPFQHYNQKTGYAFNSPDQWGPISVDKQGVIWGIDRDAIFRFDYPALQLLKPLTTRIKNVRLHGNNISWYSLKSGAYPANSKDSTTAVNEMVLKFHKTLSDQDIQSMSDEFERVTFDSITGPDFLPVNLKIPFQNNNIGFEFGSISPSFGKYAQYQYKLEGYDKNWSALSTKSEASFGNMGEGNYTFHVKALSSFGSWSETSYSFIVLPPWYRTWWAYALYVILFVSGVGLFIRWRTKALQNEKMELEEKVNTRTSELKESLENLKSTQAQLIQSEKMASLGELTAGIAHEIQNPLNFVNNFSEVSNELLDEVIGERRKEKGERDEALEEEILVDLKENLGKINHHGKRASDIVKGMLEHSRKSTGEKELTDINALCDEYLRLSYHGLRAKDKNFNADFELIADENLPKINVIPQDMGRVILNLINNAFWAVHEKKIKPGNEDYKPKVTVSTELTNNNSLLITVKDNGNGIPQKILDKIFQPFFTTKPTGQGTGLGLSLSFDIVKAHGGEIKVITKENVGTEFTFQLPIN